jgi:hypothetical protein
MASPLIIAAGAGLVSAALFASAATGSPVAGILLYLAPLPLCLAGLGWRSAAAALSALVGTVVVGATLGPATGAVFALAIGAPMALLCHLALLSRPLTTPDGQKVVNSFEWYPVGHILGWAAVLAGALASIMVLLLGYDVDAYRDSIKTILEQSTQKGLDAFDLNEETIAKLSVVLARALPAAIAVVWLGLALFNLWMAGLIINASGRALRPWPRLDALEIPNAFFLIFAAALLVSLLPGVAGLLATGFAGALFFAYVLQGLAVLHVYTRGLPFRALLLAAIYLGILLLGWIAIVVAMLGLAEPILRLRAAAAAREQSNGSD